MSRPTRAFPAPLPRLAAYWAALFAALFTAPALPAADYLSHRLDDQSLHLRTTEFEVRLTARHQNAFEVHYQTDRIRQMPSFAIGEPLEPTKVTLREEKDRLIFTTKSLTAEIQKSPFRLSYAHNDQPLLREETGFFALEHKRGFRFHLSQDEKLMGGGQRVLGMDRRGHRLPLYNRPHYGYNTESDQMYYGLPAVLSSKKYILLFDNSAKGALDLGKTDPDILQFEAVAGRTAYLVIAAPTYPQLIENYVKITGKQPLPPRWALGNYASRFGYRNAKQVRAVAAKFRQAQIPLDALVIDIYWFGPDIQGHMGNLDWDRRAFPQPEKMIADLRKQGIKTLLVTEPFILTSSKNWQPAVAAGVLARNLQGTPKTFDFYFGNTGLLDLFDDKAADWFWQFYRQQFAQGVAGVWGDLGEPEVHPWDALHTAGPADAVHNAYGHRWAELIFQRHTRDYPARRPLILMRSGFAGSQRYGMIPWTGDVDRSWGGLQSQVELNLQMGLLGLAYTHSDLGGFAGGETFDRELYLRWLQFGIFQPIFRPHAQEHIPPEPVFHDPDTLARARNIIELRYRLTPYLYTLAWQNSTTGMPLARPLFFEDENDPNLIDRTDSFLWGDALLVRPVTAPGVTAVDTYFPKGIWFDFQTKKRYSGGRTHRTPTNLDSLPVFVRAGTFIPLVPVFQSLDDYSSEQLSLHYYADRKAGPTTAQMFEDDGHSRTSIADGAFELLRFHATPKDRSLTLRLERTGKGYPGTPKSRQLNLQIHNWPRRPKSVLVDGQPLPPADLHFDRRAKTLQLALTWQQPEMELVIR